jgi:hypothetical protein
MSAPLLHQLLYRRWHNVLDHTEIKQDKTMMLNKKKETIDDVIAELMLLDMKIDDAIEEGKAKQHDSCPIN